MQLKKIVVQMMVCGLFGVANNAYAAANCSQVSRVCIDGPSTKEVTLEGGGTTKQTRDCWQYAGKYECRDGPPNEGCKSLTDIGCYEVSRTCTEMENDVCTVYDKKMHCDVAGTPAVLDTCSMKTACSGGECFDVGYVADSDFGSTIAMMETARQMGRYMDENTKTFFGGVHRTCLQRDFVNCCAEVDAPLKTNRDVGKELGMTAATSLASSAGNYLWDYGASMLSQYMFDTAFAGIAAAGAGAAGGAVAGAAESVAAAGAGAANGIATSASFTMGVGYMGVGVSIGSTAAVGAAGVTSALGTTTVATAAVGEGLSVALTFNPYMFAIMAAIMLYQELTSCDEPDKVTAAMRSNNLCIWFADEKKKSWGGLLKEVKKHHCCFNSKLARIVREAGRDQLGLGFGTPGAPACGGLAMSDVKRLDFSRIDMSEFIADVSTGYTDAQIEQRKEVMKGRAENRLDIMKQHQNAHSIVNANDPVKDPNADGM